MINRLVWERVRERTKGETTRVKGVGKGGEEGGRDRPRENDK